MNGEVPAKTLPIAPAHYNIANELYKDKQFHRRAIAVLLALCLIIAVDDVTQRYKHGQVLPFLLTLKEGEYVQTVGIIPATFDLATTPGPVITVLSLWLTFTRELTTDSVAWGKFFSLAEAYSTTRIQQELVPFKESQRERLNNGYATSLEIINPPQPIAGTLNRTWEMDWREVTTDVKGLPVAQDSGVFHGTFKVAQLHMKDALKPGEYVNAIRVYVEDFKIQKRSL